MPTMRISIVIASLMAACVASLSHAEDAARSADGRLVYKSLTGGRDLSLWYYLPSGHDPGRRRPAVVLFHGGSWRTGTPASMARQAAGFADAGLVAFTVEYRLADNSGTDLIESTKDARSAMRWLKSHAPELGIDAAKIVAGGGSAGGQLAAALATTDRVNHPDDDLAVDPTPVALVLFNPAVNFQYRGFLRGNLPTAPAAGGRTADELAVADPIRNVKGKFPPCVIFHGTADDVVPIGAAEEFTAAVGGACTLIRYEGREHGFYNRSPTDFADVMRRSLEFLRSQALLPTR